MKKYTKEEIQGFLDEELAQFRDWANKAGSPAQQEMYLRFCDATSYLKQSFKVWKIKKK